MKVTLLGYGEIGSAVHEVVSPYHDVAIHDPAKGHFCDEHCDVLLVAIPYSEHFHNAVDAFIAKTIIVFSTVPVGTCRSLEAVHSPVEGKHPNLAQSLRISPRWLGGEDDDAYHFLKSCGFDVKVLPSPDMTEWLKLRSTTLYGVNIEFARYSASVCDSLGMPYDLCTEWDADYNDLYRGLGMEWAQRYLLTRPEGPKGGHCVTPNARLLMEQYPDPLVSVVAE